MEKKITGVRTLTVTVTDYDNGDNNYTYANALRSVELIGICEHLRVMALTTLGKSVVIEHVEVDNS